MDQAEIDRRNAMYRKVVAQAWSDPAFKAKLLAEPHAALAAAGVPIARGMTVKVVENSDNVFHLVLPAKPAGELSEAELDSAVGGTTVIHMLIPAV